MRERSAGILDRIGSGFVSLIAEFDGSEILNDRVLAAFRFFDLFAADFRGLDGLRVVAVDAGERRGRFGVVVVPRPDGLAVGVIMIERVLDFLLCAAGAFHQLQAGFRQRRLTDDAAFDVEDVLRFGCFVKCFANRALVAVILIVDLLDFLRPGVCGHGIGNGDRFGFGRVGRAFETDAGKILHGLIRGAGCGADLFRSDIRRGNGLRNAAFGVRAVERCRRFGVVVVPRPDGITVGMRMRCLCFAELEIIVRVRQVVALTAQNSALRGLGGVCTVMAVGVGRIQHVATFLRIASRSVDRNEDTGHSRAGGIRTILDDQLEAEVRCIRYDDIGAAESVLVVRSELELNELVLRPFLCDVVLVGDRVGGLHAVDLGRTPCERRVALHDGHVAALVDDALIAVVFDRRNDVEQRYGIIAVRRSRIGIALRQVRDEGAVAVIIGLEHVARFSRIGRSVQGRLEVRAVVVDDRRKQTQIEVCSDRDLHFDNITGCQRIAVLYLCLGVVFADLVDVQSVCAGSIVSDEFAFADATTPNDPNTIKHASRTAKVRFAIFMCCFPP